MSTSADEREGISCSLRKEQIAVFPWMEMSSHKLLKPTSPLKLQNSTLHSCLLPCARSSQSSEVHVFCCPDNKVTYGYVHIRLKWNKEIKETMTWKRTVSTHPWIGRVRDVNCHQYNQTYLDINRVTQLSLCNSSILPEGLSHNFLSLLFSNTTPHHTILPPPLCWFNIYRTFTEHTRPANCTGKPHFSFPG